ncbi:DUF6461 domain-containing protein [Streptomyces sp. NPDC051214]|uniref:DUF6461 domain-containing protein n=1 Tax=Streptomyces sp. NPDC051214 TaxID=3155282 RepID=UPI003423D678
MDHGLRWIANGYDGSYTFTLCQGITPRELLVRIGAKPHHIHELTDLAVSELSVRPEDGHLSDLEFLDWEDDDLVTRLTEAGFLSHPETIVRAGAIPGWAYAIEAFTSRSRNHLGELSRGTRAYTVFSSGAGMQRVGHARDGQVLSDYEPQEAAGPGAAEAEEEVPGFAYTGEETADRAFLGFLEDELGIHIAWEDTCGPLPTAAFADAFS